MLTNTIYLRGLHMIIQDSSVNLMFNKIDNLKKTYILNEGILKDSFNEATILPIPDDAPTEIPRILMTSQKEHSQLSVGPEAITLQTTYDDAYNTNWDECENYVKTRLDEVFLLSDKLTNSYNYIGMVVNLIIDNISEKAQLQLFENLFKHKAVDNLDDISVKYTYILEKKYYVNITVQSIRAFKNIAIQKAGMFSKDNILSHTIGINLDINDRCAFNYNSNYESSKEEFSKILEIMTNLINNELDTIVSGGEVKWQKQ